LATGETGQAIGKVLSRPSGVIHMIEMILETIIGIAMIIVVIYCIYGSYVILKLWDLLVAPGLKEIVREEQLKKLQEKE
jgi:hypothetical protein